MGEKSGTSQDRVRVGTTTHRLELHLLQHPSLVTISQHRYSMAFHGSPHLRALYAVFVRPALRSASLPSRTAASLLHPSTPRHQPLSTSQPRLALRKGPKIPPQKARPSQQNQQLRDNDIPARRVQVVDEHGQLGEPQTKFSAMRSFDPATHRLVCVSKPPRYLSPGTDDYELLAINYDVVVEQWQRWHERFGPNGSLVQHDGGTDDPLKVPGPGGLEIDAVHRAPAILVMPGRYIRLPSGGEWVPVCKVEDKAEAAARAREAEAARKEQRKLAPAGIKVIELNWAIDPNDLGHRLSKLAEFLNARRRVEVVVAPKRRGRKASPEECAALIKRIKETVHKVDGAKELRPMQGKVGNVVSFMLEGNREKQVDH